MKKQNNKPCLSNIAKIVVVVNALGLAGYILGTLYGENPDYRLMPYLYFALVFMPINLLSGFELAFNQDKLLLPYLLAIIPLQFLTQSISFGVRDFLWINSICQAVSLTFGIMLGWLLSKLRTSKRTK